MAKPDFVRDESGREVFGLRTQPSDRKDADGQPITRYYSKVDKHRIYHGDSRDKAVAIFRFRAWEAAQGGQAVPIQTAAVDTLAVGGPVAFVNAGGEMPNARRLELKEGKIVETIEIPEAAFWAKMRQVLMDDPTLAAQKTGIPSLARLESLPKVTHAPRLNLADIIDEYAGQQKPILDADGNQVMKGGIPAYEWIGGRALKYDRQRTDALRIWKIFTRSVNADNIEDITTEDIAAFRDALERYKTSTSKKHKKAVRKVKPRTIKNAITTVCTILNSAADIHKDHRTIIGELKSEIRRICKRMKTKKIKPEPKPISVKSYLALLEAAKKDKRQGEMWYAILLTGLNLALHGTELTEVKISECDLENREFKTERTKTGVARVARLWNRTVNAIKTYKATPHFKSNETDLLFTNRSNEPYNINKIARKFRTLRKRAGLKDDVVFDGLRDLFRTAAGAKNVIAARWVMGHATGNGIDDVYGFREVAETEEVMSKVERYVFGE